MAGQCVTEKTVPVVPDQLGAEEGVVPSGVLEFCAPLVEWVEAEPLQVADLEAEVRGRLALQDGSQLLRVARQDDLGVLFLAQEADGHHALRLGRLTGLVHDAVAAIGKLMDVCL